MMRALRIGLGAIMWEGHRHVGAIMWEGHRQGPFGLGHKVSLGNFPGVVADSHDVRRKYIQVCGCFPPV